MLGISSTATLIARRQRIVASISLDMLILSTMLVPQAKPAQIISLCPMLLEEGATTVPCNLVGNIFTVFISLPQILRHLLPIELQQITFANAAQDNNGNAIAIFLLVTGHSLQKLALGHARIYW